MLSKELKRQFEEELDTFGSCSGITYDPRSVSSPSSLRTTALYVAGRLGIEIQTEFINGTLWCQRVDAPAELTDISLPLDIHIVANWELLSRHTEILRPTYGDPLYDLKNQIYLFMSMAMKAQVNRLKQHIAETAAENGDDHED